MDECAVGRWSNSLQDSLVALRREKKMGKRKGLRERGKQKPFIIVRRVKLRRDVSLYRDGSCFQNELKFLAKKDVDLNHKWIIIQNFNI